MKKDNSGAVIGCLVLFASLPIGALWSGYVLSILWAWFIVPTFETRPLAVLPAIGISLVVRYLTNQYDAYTDETKSTSERAFISLVYTFAHPALALVFGWVLHSFM